MVGKGPTLVTWSPQAGAVYDIVGGTIAGIVTDGGVSGAECLEDGVAGDSWADARADPSPYQSYYYLVRSEKSCGPGSYGTGSGAMPRQPVFDCP